MAGNTVYLCPRCRAQLAPGAQFCGSCGQAVAQPPPSATPPQTAPVPQASPAVGPAPGYGYAQPVPPRSSNTALIVLAVVFLGLLVAGGAVGIGWYMLQARKAPPAETTAVLPPSTSSSPSAPAAVETPTLPVAPLAPAARVAVPNVVGLSRADAERNLEATGGFQFSYNPSRYSDRWGAGTIIAQSPAPGTVMESGDTVYLVESRGLAAAPTPATPATPRRTSGGGSYLLPGSDSHYLHGGEVQGLSNWQLTLARNEIYARHGRPFDNPHIRNYFMSQGWYAPDPRFSESRLSQIERTNAEFIRDWQIDRYGRAATSP